MAAVVARRRRDGPGGWTHSRRLSVRSAGAGARRAVLLRDQPLARLVAAVRKSVGPEHSQLGDSGAVADCRVAAGGILGRVRVPRDSARARCADRRALRPPSSGHRDRVRAAGGGVRCRARELSGAAGILAPRRAARAVDVVGGDLPALWPPADDHPARDVRSRAVCDSGVSRRRAGRAPAAGDDHRGGTGPAWRRAVAPCSRRRVVRAVGASAQRRVAAGRTRSRRRRASGARGRAGHRGPLFDRVPARAAAARCRRPRGVDRVHAVSHRRAGAGPRARRRREVCRRCARGARRQARPRVAAHVGDPARQRRSGTVELAQVHLAREGRRRVPRAGRQRAAAAAMGSALRNV